MKFYVYVIKTGSSKDLEFVEISHVKYFANSVFDPAIMEFTGIMVDAESPDQAKEVYLNPSCGFGEYVLLDEPIETATIRSIAAIKSSVIKSFDATTHKLNTMRVILKMQRVADKMREANELLNQVANDIYDMYSDESHSVEDIFNKISKPSIEATIKFNGKSKDA